MSDLGWKTWLIGALWMVVMALVGGAWAHLEKRVSAIELERDLLILLEERQMKLILTGDRLEQKIDWLICREYDAGDQCGRLP